jgi:hypothetical protein
VSKSQVRQPTNEKPADLHQRPATAPHNIKLIVTDGRNLTIGKSLIHSSGLFSEPG